MQIKTNELINFLITVQEFIKVSSERISNLIKFLQKHDNYERDISFIYSLLPSIEKKRKLKNLFISTLISW